MGGGKVTSHQRLYHFLLIWEFGFYRPVSREFSVVLQSFLTLGICLVSQIFYEPFPSRHGRIIFSVCTSIFLIFVLSSSFIQTVYWVMILSSLSFRLQGSEPRRTDVVSPGQSPLKAFLPDLDNNRVMKHTPQRAI